MNGHTDRQIDSREMRNEKWTDRLTVRHMHKMVLVALRQNSRKNATIAVNRDHFDLTYNSGMQLWCWEKIYVLTDRQTDRQGEREGGRRAERQTN